MKANGTKYIVNGAIILILSALSFYYLASSKIITFQSISKIKWYYYVLLSAFCFVAYAYFGYYEKVVYNTFSPYSYKTAFTSFLCGNLGSNVTPLKSGHFPLIAYYHHTSNIPKITTLTGECKRQILSSITSIIVYLIITIVLAILKSSIVFYNKTIALWLVSGVGLIFHLVVFGLVIGLACNGQFQFFALTFCAKILKLIKRIKTQSEQEIFIKSKTERINLYKNQILVIFKDARSYILPIMLYSFSMLLNGSFQYVAYLLISGATPNWSDLFTFYVLNLATTYITNIVPIPGGVGTAEFMFGAIYSLVIPKSIIGQTLILWRVSTYYVVVLVELIIFIVATRGNRDITKINAKQSKQVSKSNKML